MWVTVLFLAGIGIGNVLAQVPASQCYATGPDSTVHAALKDYLAKKTVSNVNVPPVSPVNGPPTTLYINFVLVSLQEIDEQRNSITVTGALDINWDVSSLGYYWTPSEFCNVTTFTLSKAQATTWMPKLSIVNMINLNDFRDLLEKTPIDINGLHGTATMQLYSTFELSCNLRLKAFPLDHQICSANISILAEFAYVNFSSLVNPVCTTGYVPNPQWEFVGSRGTVQGDFIYDPQTLQSLDIYVIQFIFERQPLFHLLSLIIPTVLLGFAGAAMFIIPPNSGEKMGVCFVVVLSFQFIFSTLISSFPPNSTDIPLLYYYLLTLFITTIVGTILAAIILYVAGYLEQLEGQIEENEKASGDESEEIANELRKEKHEQPQNRRIYSATKEEPLTKKAERIQRYLNIANMACLVAYLFAVILFSVVYLGLIVADAKADAPEAGLSVGPIGSVKMRGGYYFRPLPSFYNCIQCTYNLKTGKLSSETYCSP